MRRYVHCYIEPALNLLPSHDYNVAGGGQTLPLLQKEKRPESRFVVARMSPRQTMRLRSTMAGFSKAHSTMSPGFR